jgi:chromosome segregation ATPase
MLGAGERDFRGMVSDVDALVSSMRALGDQHEALRGRFEQLEREHTELQRNCTEPVERANEETSEALAELRGAYQALLVEFEARNQTLRELRAEHGVLLHEREEVAAELAVILRFLRTSGEVVVLDAPARNWMPIGATDRQPTSAFTAGVDRP